MQHRGEEDSDHSPPLRGGAEQDRAAQWERQWSRSDFLPLWRTKEVPGEIRDAVERGWFPQGARVLDVGCGSGEITAWLAAHGCPAIGIDIAPSAIARAEEAYGDVPGLAFVVDDICARREDRGSFDALLDRGCLHALPPHAKTDYVSSVSGLVGPGAPFLLLYGCPPAVEPDEETVREVEKLCGATFAIQSVAQIVMAGDATPDIRRGVAICMARR